MEATKRELHTFTVGLSAEQIAAKKRLMRETAVEYANVPEYFRELVVDFCVRHEEEATRIRETGEWETTPTKFSPQNMEKLSNHKV